MPLTDAMKGEYAKQKAVQQTRDAEKRRIMLDLRVAGLACGEIAAQMTRMGYKISEGTVRVRLAKLLENMAQDDQRDLEHLREIDLRRIDEAIKVLFPKVREGNLRAMREYRAFIDQRARLLGLYAATKHEVNGQISHILDPSDREEMHRLEEAFLTGSATEIGEEEFLLLEGSEQHEEATP